MSEPKTFIGKYIFSRDHKVIGIQYIVTAIIMGLVAAALAVIIRMQLMSPAEARISPEAYISIVTMHGSIMIFFVVSLALVSGFGNLLIPLQVGARDMAYPTLNMLSYWTIVPGCLLMIVSFFVEGGAAAAGWTAYPPLSALEGAVPGSGLGQTLWLLAMALFVVSFTMGGLNYVTTILNMRAKGLSMMKLPLTAWTFFISALLGLLSFPALTAAAILLLLDRHLGTSFYLPEGMIIGEEVLANSGGTPILFQHLFWFLGHPEVYVLVLPGIGMAFDVVSAFARRQPFGYKTTVWALLIVAVLSMIVWGHHMFTSGMNPYLGEYFSIATVLITLPFAVIGINLLASLWRGRIRLTCAMHWALALVSAVGLGGFGGLFLGTATSDMYLHETYFVVGHFHLMIGTVTLFSIFAGLYFWFPKMFGRLMNETLGKIHFWLTAPGMIAIFVMMHYQGMGGSLRRAYDPTIYEFAQPTRVLAAPITYVAFIVIGAQVLFLFNFFRCAFAGEKASANPWGATTVEWASESPPPHGNWGATMPVVTSDPYVYDREAAAGAQDFVPQVKSS